MPSRVITLAALALAGLAVHPVAGAALIPDDQEKASLKDEEIVALKEEVVALKAQLKLKKVHREAAHNALTSMTNSSDASSAKPASSSQGDVHCGVRSAAELSTIAPARTVAIALLAVMT